MENELLTNKNDLPQPGNVSNATQNIGVDGWPVEGRWVSKRILVMEEMGVTENEVENAKRWNYIYVHIIMILIGFFVCLSFFFLDMVFIYSILASIGIFVGMQGVLIYFFPSMINLATWTIPVKSIRLWGTYIRKMLGEQNYRRRILWSYLAQLPLAPFWGLQAWLTYNNRGASREIDSTSLIIITTIILLILIIIINIGIYLQVEKLESLSVLVKDPSVQSRQKK